MNLHRTLVILMLFFGISTSFAQKSCLNTLREAKDLYEQGLIDEIPDLLSDCMVSGFTRAQRIEAYKLIILAYLFDDDQFAAENMMDDFLRKFPEYEIMPNDPVEFVYLLESYKTSSFYSINLTFGPSFTNPMVTQHYSVLDQNLTEFSNRTGAGFHFGLGLSRNLFKSVNGNIGLFYAAYNYTFHEETKTALGQSLYNFTEVKTTEELRRLDVPVTLTYSFGKGNLNYVLRFGGLVGFISQASLTPVRRHQESLVSDIAETFDIKESRSSYDFGLVIGGGLEYKIPRGYLVLDLRYNMGFKNIVLPETRNTNTRLYSQFFYIDDDYRLNNFLVSVGYHFSIYQSKKNRF